MADIGSGDTVIVVRDLASARAGDKGGRSNIVVVADDGTAFEHLDEVLTECRVAEAFDPLIEGDVSRYAVPQLQAFNFVLEDALGGDVTTTLRQDVHGKSLSYVLLGIEIPPPE